MNTTQIYGEELNESFHQAVKNAQNLVYYASNNGIKIETSHLNNIVKAKEFFDKESIEPQFEVEFWQSLRELSEKVKPVSIESINSIFERRNIEEEEIKYKFPKGYWLRIKRFFRGYTRRIPMARRISKRLRGFALLTMLVMLFLQIYWVVGVALINDSNQMETQIELKNKRLIFLSDSLGIHAAESNEILSLEEGIANLDIELNVRLNVLISWNYLWRNFPWILKNNRDTESLQGEDMSTRFRRNLVQAKFVVDALYAYFLPLLYGLLGAFVFVLRQLTYQIRNITYTKESNINFGLRLHLGALAGLAIGWFASPDNSTNWTLSSLSPLAIAFLAGYSVELLFTIMDRLISPKDDRK